MSSEEERKESEQRSQERKALMEQIRVENEYYLTKYEGYMRKLRFTDSSIQRQTKNTRFYLQEVLLPDCLTMLDGISEATPFLQRRYAEEWGAKKGDLERMKQSLKRFYRGMCDLCIISDEDYDRLIESFQKGLSF